MVNTLTSLADFDRLFLGFDRMKHELANHGTPNNYPRYNIVKGKNDKYKIEMDLVGWSKDNVSVCQDGNALTIEGVEKEGLMSEEQYIYKGISGKNFRRVFTLGEYVKIQDASMENGLLVVKLAVDVPEEEKPKFIDIS
jgi:molecular chaperone IbpA